MFELPRGVTGYGKENTREAVGRKDFFTQWVRSLASANHSKVVEVPVAEPWPSFTTLGIDRLEIWLLHNNHVPLVGVLTVPPEPGSSWAAAGGYVDLEVPTHAAGWRPQLLGAAVLNAPLEPSSLDLLASAERELADRYKPQTIGHVIFNYWA